jgi:hypothetical protein
MPNRLSAKPILNYQNVNSFKYGNQWSVSAGDSDTLYYQLVDLDQCGLRYIAGECTNGVPAAMRVTFPSCDNAQAFTLVASQVACDGSIWSITIPSTSTPHSGNVIFQLYEGNSLKSFTGLQFLVVGTPQNNGSDGNLPDNTIFF